MAEVLPLPCRSHHRLSPDSTTFAESPHCESTRSSANYTKTLSYCATRGAWIPNIDNTYPQTSICRYSPAKHSLLETDLGLDNDTFDFPDYDAGWITSDNGGWIAQSQSRSESPSSFFDDWFSELESLPRTADDSCLGMERPTRHVDYLTHEWEQEELWSTWRYASRNSNCLRDGKRLENAAWRAWAKTKDNLPTIPPEDLAWIKVADVTWLFGPIAEDGREQFPSSPTPNSVASSVCEHNAETRPILKKRATISEAILQHSLSSDCLIQHANLPPKPQTKGHPFGLERTVSDNVVPTAHVGSSLRATPSSQSPTSSEMSSRSTNSRRHISFNRVVSQVIAVGREEDYDDDDDETESDSTLVTMKPLHPRRSSNGSNVSKSSFNSDTRTIIAHLPPTTLKDDSDAEKEHEFRHINWSQDRPSLFREYSDDFKYPEASKLGATSEHIEFFEFENDWFEKATPVNIPSSPSTPFPVAETVHTTSTNGAWFRPSPEGFVPFFEYDRDRGKVDEESHADLQTGPGLIGRIVDIVHTVRDIAHVVWNVGWRL